METTIVFWFYIQLVEKKLETTIIYWGIIGIMEKKMETAIVYWDYISIMGKKMETTIWGLHLEIQGMKTVSGGLPCHPL